MIARVIVKAHRGSINAESSGRNQGTTLIIDLPTGPEISPLQ